MICIAARRNHMITRGLSSLTAPRGVATAAEMDDYNPRSLILWDRLHDAIPEPVTPHARELVGDEMMDV